MAAFDVVVLGGGTAGVHVATEVAGGGKTVALVEAGLSRGEPWEDAVARRTEVTGGLDDSAAAQRLNRAGVQVIRGTGRITAPGTVEVTLAPDADKPAGGRWNFDRENRKALPAGASVPGSKRERSDVGVADQ